MCLYHKVCISIVTVLVSLLLISACVVTLKVVHLPGSAFPLTQKEPVVEELYGVTLTDDYRWLEDGDNPDVQQWIAEQEKYTHSVLDPLSQRKWLASRFDELWHYDDESKPEKVLDGERSFFWRKSRDHDYRVIFTKKNDESPEIEILNPNTWGDKQTLDYWEPSRDGSYIAIGKARGGDENPVLMVMEVETEHILPDRVRGQRQRINSWLPDNSGFYYTANPVKGEVQEDEEFYWQSTYLHKLGTPASRDVKVFSHDTVKEYHHWVDVQEDAIHAVYYRIGHEKDEVFLGRLGVDEPLVPMAQGFDAQYRVFVVEDRIFITTDSGAPKKQVFVTEVEKPEREHWQLFIPESDDILKSLIPAAGHLYAVYSHNVYTVIKVYKLDGTFVRQVSLPMIGTATVRGYWSRDEVYIRFSSFTYPATTFRYDAAADKLIVHRPSPLKVDVSNYTSKQVWFQSKDGTRVSMFLVFHKDIGRDGSNPVLLTGYGGFGVALQPQFSTLYTVWIQAGGMLAIPNLRGGGEYGREWHEAGMLDKKQNVFDDFIAAAEWLFDEGYTRPAKLAIEGGSNGGLLVGAVLVQRPDLCRVVLCSMPLLDMVRYHKFGFGNIWAKEYGTAEDADQFKYLYRYSPYHNVKDGEHYPAVLVIGAENDARVDPLHARKMVARLQNATASDEPVMLLIHRDAGHQGGITINALIEQYAMERAFLMDKLGMKTPKEGP